jgi:hypothetical protein
MSERLPRWVHRDLPRSAPPDSWRSLRSARVPPMDYLDQPRSDEHGSRFNRRNRAKWVSIQPALTPPMPYLVNPAVAGNCMNRQGDVNGGAQGNASKHRTLGTAISQCHDLSTVSLRALFLSSANRPPIRLRRSLLKAQPVHCGADDPFRSGYAAPRRRRSCAASVGKQVVPPATPFSTSHGLDRR